MVSIFITTCHKKITIYDQNEMKRKEKYVKNLLHDDVAC
jgi:hypothetical protein